MSPAGLPSAAPLVVEMEGRLPATRLRWSLSGPLRFEGRNVGSLASLVLRALTSDVPFDRGPLGTSRVLSLQEPELFSYDWATSQASPMDFFDPMVVECVSHTSHLCRLDLLVKGPRLVSPSKSLV